MKPPKDNQDIVDATLQVDFDEPNIDDLADEEEPDEHTLNPQY